MMAAVPGFYSVCIQENWCYCRSCQVDRLRLYDGRTANQLLNDLHVATENESAAVNNTFTEVLKQVCISKAFRTRIYETTRYINTASYFKKIHNFSQKSASELKSLSGKTIKRVEDFKYLGAYIMDSHKDFRVRTALAWVACNKLEKIWRSNINNSIKVELFQSLVEPILMYGAETWTLITVLQRRLYGTYTNLLRRAQNIHWKEHATLQRIYGKLKPISSRLCQKRLQFAGHCYRADDEIVSSLLLLRPTGTVK